MTSSPADRSLSLRSLAALPAVCALVIVWGSAAAAQTMPAFGVPTPYAFYGTNVGALASGDLNGDGNADVVAVAGSLAGVRVGLGNGTGQLIAHGTFGTGAGPNAIALADFNGDGTLDAVTSNNNNFTGTTFSVLIGTGTGAFAGEATYPIGIAFHVITKVAAGDVTGDGRPDIVTLSGKGCGANTAGCSTVTVWANNGSGGFASVFTRAFASPNGYYYSGYADVQVADVNHDARGDLVLAIGTYDNGNEPQLQVMPGSGSGSFGTTKYYRYPLVNGGRAFHTVSVAVGDVTGDSRLDIVAMAQRAPGSNSHVIVMRNDGTGEFPQASGSAHSMNWFYGTGVQIGDLNDDGALDIAASLQNGSGSLGYAINGGGGTFPAAMTNIWTAGTFAITLADLNNSGPGTLDVALGSPGGVTVFLNGTPTAAACAAGTYSTSGNEPCTPAGAGYFVATEGATSQTPCPSGSYSDQTGSVSCTLAPPGSYAPGPGAQGSLLCAAGTYSASAGSAACTPADAGFFVPSLGATSQSACPAGYSSAAGAFECYPLDTDGDGVNDVDDAVPNSDMQAAVRVGTCSAGVASQVMPNGATFNDLLAAGVNGAATHGQRVSVVTALSNGWKNAGLISGRDHGAIVSCTARAK